jgi:hypothetical protein
MFRAERIDPTHRESSPVESLFILRAEAQRLSSSRVILVECSRSFEIVCAKSNITNHRNPY